MSEVPLYPADGRACMGGITGTPARKMDALARGAQLTGTPTRRMDGLERVALQGHLRGRWHDF